VHHHRSEQLRSRVAATSGKSFKPCMAHQHHTSSMSGPYRMKALIAAVTGVTGSSCFRRKLCETVVLCHSWYHEKFSYSHTNYAWNLLYRIIVQLPQLSWLSCHPAICLDDKYVVSGHWRLNVSAGGHRKLAQCVRVTRSRDMLTRQPDISVVLKPTDAAMLQWLRV
jgi:hypothetical protein